MATRGNRLAGALAAALLFVPEALWMVRGGALRFDQAVRAAVYGRAWEPLTRALRAVTMAGSEWVLLPLGAVLVWWLVRAGRRRQAVLLAGGALTAEGAVQLLKLAFHRTRPEVFFGLAPAESYSFPSGHAFLSVVFYGLLAEILLTFGWERGRRRAIAAGAVLAAGMIGFSRVYLGYHYPSDVLGGWTCGLAWLQLAAALFEPQEAAAPPR